MTELKEDERSAVELHYRLWSTIRSSSSESKPVVFDVGASHGQTSKAYLDRLPGATLVACEANPALLNVLKGLGIVVVHCAVGAPTGQPREEISFNVNQDDTTSSVLEVEPFLRRLSPAYAPTEVIRVPYRSIDELVDQLGLSPDILKIDTQGNDAAVLEGALGTMRRRPPSIVSTEMFFASAYMGQSDWIDSSCVLRDAGYRLHSFTRLVSTSQNNLYFGDATWLSAEAWVACGLR